MTDSTDLLLRMRAAAAGRVQLLVVLALVTAGIGGAITYQTTVASEATTEERSVELVESNARFTHQATVQNPSEAFSQGQTLTQQPLYFTSVAPVLDGRYLISYSTARAAEIDAATSITLVIKEVGDDTVYWRVSEPVTSTTTSNLAADETATTGFSINVSSIDQRAQRIREELDASPGEVRTAVVARTQFEGTVAGTPVERTMRTRLTVSTDGDTYQVESDETTARLTRTEQVTVPPSQPLYLTAGGPVLLGLGLVLLGGVSVGWWRSAFELSVRDQHRLERAQFAEWISTGSVPEAGTDGATVEVDSLEALVDVAIDTNGRVIEDRRRGQYVVIEGTTRYTYQAIHLTAQSLWERGEAAGLSESGNGRDPTDSEGPEKADEAGPAQADAEPGEEERSDEGGGPAGPAPRATPGDGSNPGEGAAAEDDRGESEDEELTRFRPPEEWAENTVWDWEPGSEE
jgi:hypothetical protein